MSGNETVEVAGELVEPFETDAAYHFTDGDVTAWVPKSQSVWDPDAKEMTMPEWLATDKGFV